MSFPWLAAALLAASMYSNYKGQQQVNEYRKRAERESKRRTDENYRAAESARQRSTESVENTQKSHEQASEARTDKYQEAQASTSAAPNLISPEARGSSAVVKEEARQRGEARDFTNKSAVARGRLDALGDVFLNQGLTMADTGRDIRQYGDQTRGWTQNVLPFELQKAAHMGDEQFMLGDLFSMAAAMSAQSGVGSGGGTGTGGIPFQNSGSFAGGSASIPTMSSGASFGGMPAWNGSGTNWDFWNGWNQYAGQFGQALGKGF